MRIKTSAAGLVLALALAGCGGATHHATHPAGSTGSSSTSRSATSRSGMPQAAHVVVVVLENHGFADVLGNSGAPFLNRLAARGASLTQFYAITHPSEPNYLAMFSGSTQGLSSDACPVRYTGANLARSLLDSGRTFTGYAEGLPRPGFAGCTSGDYVRRHCPWINFTNLPAGVSRPMTAFPTDYGSLPTVSFVIPDLQHDMHDGTVAQADSWLQQHLSGYARWAPDHNSLLIITADEDDGSTGNRIPAIIAGAGVRAGQYGQRYSLYSLLRLIEDLYHLPRLAHSAGAVPITGIWD